MAGYSLVRSENLMRAGERLPSILFHRGTAWNGSVRGSTNILARFFRDAGYPVTWVSRPSHAGHAIFRQREGYRLGSKWQRHPDGVLEINPFTALPIIKRARFGSEMWRRSAELGYATIAPSLARIFRQAGHPRPDVIWTSGGDGGRLKAAFPGSRAVMQCVDVYEAYAGPAQNSLERRDYETADAVVAIGNSLAEYLVRERGLSRDRITVIGQGADLALFAAARDEPPEMAHLPHPRLVWVGVLAKADADLMAAALSGLPDNGGSLILIGPSAPWADDLAAKDRRVLCLGPRPAHEVAAFLNNSDIGLMLYRRDVNPLVYEGQNPLKLYEMAAAGLPIVSTSHAEYRYVGPPALIADTPEAVAAAIPALRENAPSYRERALRFAAGNGWQSRFKQAQNLIHGLLENRPQYVSVP